MTLIVAFKGPEGLVLGADSRATVAVTMETGQRDVIYFDNATKVFSLEGQPHIGLLTWGQYFLGSGRPVGGFLPDFQSRLAAHGDTGRLRVVDIASEIGKFYSEQWRNAAMPSDTQPLWFLVAGFDEGDVHGRMYQVSVPGTTAPVEQHVNDFGLQWGGESELIGRLLNGVDPRAAAVAKSELTLRDNQVRRLETRWRSELQLRIPYDSLPLQDGVDLVVYLVTMTSVGQSFPYGRDRGVGGAVDVATITRADGFLAVRQKQIEVRAPFPSSRSANTGELTQES